MREEKNNYKGSKNIYCLGEAFKKNSPKSSRLSAFPATNFTLLHNSFGNCEAIRLFSC